MSPDREPPRRPTMEPLDEFAPNEAPQDNGPFEDDLFGDEPLLDTAPPDALPLLPMAPAEQAAPAAEQAPEPIDPVVTIRFLGIVAILISLFMLPTLDGPQGLPLPAFLFVAGLVLIFYIGTPARLHREQVIDRWDHVIDGASGRREAVIASTLFRIDQQGLSNVQYAQADLAPGILRGLAGVTRPFLVVSHLGNRRLRPYRMHVNVRDYGQNLQTNWYLTYHRGFFEKLEPNPLIGLDLFDEQDLRAYTTVVHRCLVEAVVELLSTLGQDASTLDRGSKGFLGIS